MLNSSDILRGYTDTIILAQLAEGDSYGYVISKNVQEITRGELQLKEATLYTTFRRLEAAGIEEGLAVMEEAEKQKLTTVRLHTGEPSIYGYFSCSVFFSGFSCSFC